MLLSEGIPLEQGLRHQQATTPNTTLASEGIPLEQGLRQISHKLIHKNLSYRVFHQNKDLERKLGDSNLKYGKSIAIPPKTRVTNKNLI